MTFDENKIPYINTGAESAEETGKGRKRKAPTV